jgi:hypothetical protein
MEDGSAQRNPMDIDCETLKLKSSFSLLDFSLFTFHSSSDEVSEDTVS